MTHVEPTAEASDLIREIGLKLHARGDEFVRGSGLSVQAGHTIGWIAANQDRGVIQRELAELSGTTPASVASMVKGLEAAGYIERRTDPHDVRKNRLYVLPKAYALTEGFDQLRTDVEEELLGVLAESEQAEFVRLLRKVNTAFR